MHLKKLEIFGFKSFAHKLSLEFGPGITGVVGPNGCGKTNVADAIRWVLGEQSASELRGSSMADVIFNGTKKRRRLGMAEVSLSIDNSAGYLPTDYTEVLIGRRVFRSGESEYLLNKQSCRLRDIRDLFLDTGIGTRTYSLIERKMVDSVLSDSAGHRRFMFEEAAGIMKYKVRKRSAMNKLEATETDMQRVSDIILEVEKQVRSLKRQLAQARRHRRYTDSLSDLEVRLGRHEYAEWQRRRNEAAGRLSELRGRIASAEESLSSREGSYGSTRRDLRDKQEALSSLEAEIGELQTRSRELAEGVLVARERKGASERRVGELDTELTDIRADLSLALERAARLDEEIRATAEAVAERDGELEERGGLLATAEAEYRRLKELVDGQKQTRLEGLESSAGLKGELESYRARLDDLMREHVEIEEALADARSSLSERDEQILGALGDETGYREAAQASRAALKAANAGLNAARERLLSARERRTRLEGDLEAGRRRLDLLTEIRDGYGGFQEGVRALLSGEANGIDGICGTVADLLDVDPRMAAAVETALSGTAQYVVARDVSAARRAMRTLSDKSLGRASFIPLSELGRIAVRPVSEDLLSAPGVVGSATDFVRADEAHRGLVEFLLERVVIVSDLGSALELTARSDGARVAFVTPSGEMATTDGVLCGGRLDREEAGFLRRAERVEEAQAELGKLEELLDSARRGESASEAELERASAQVSESERAVEAADGTHWDVKRKVTELELAKTNLSDTITRLTARRDAMSVRMDRTKQDIENLAATLARVSRGEDELGERLGALERDFRTAERDRAKAQEEEKQAEIEAAALRSAVTQLKSERATLAESVLASRTSIERKSVERAQHARTVGELSERIAGDDSALSAIEDEKRGLETERDAMQATVGVLVAQIDQMEEETKGYRATRETAQTELHELELRDTELRGRCEALRDRLREEYSVDIAAPVPAPEAAVKAEDEADQVPEEPFEPAQAREEVDRLKARLRSMGPVNLLALEEYDEESKRLEFLKGQYDDLEKSKESLLEAIERINQTAQEMFVETFGHVRENFVATFRRLFEGGEADLRLLDPEAPLESPIEIVASPRGKRLGRLSLLSGGERALTAIALLFAIYLVKPSPFCILDEVDAPLDDSNVTRFVRMLREFSNRTQFVIITHNKVTMQAADRLYGITMEESGVSKVVSVRLDALDEEVELEEAAYEPA